MQEVPAYLRHRAAADREAREARGQTTQDEISALTRGEVGRQGRVALRRDAPAREEIERPPVHPGGRGPCRSRSAAGGAAWYLNRQPAEPAHAKAAKDRKDSKDAKPKGDARRDDAKRGDPSNKLAKNDPKTPREPRVDAKAPPDFQEVHGPDRTPLLKSTPLSEVADHRTAVRDVFLMQGKTPRVGVRLQGNDGDGGMCTSRRTILDKGLRVGRFPIPNDTVYLDVDPEGTVLALCDNDRFLTVYELPSGAVIRDDWRPYHDPKNEGRRIGDGDYTQFSVLSKDTMLILTTRNAGDIWDFRTPSPKFLITGFSHEEFQNSSVAKGHDSALSADRTMFAFATDEGIEFMDTMNNGAKVGKTAKLSKFGPKVDVLGIGFDPDKKSIAAYIASGKTCTLARFQVPSGEPIGAETVADPGDLANFAFISDNLFLSCEHPGGKNRDANRVAGLFDLSGRQLVECVFSPRRNGMFSTNVSGKQVAFAYLNNNKPSVGIVDIPMPGTTPAGTPPPEMASGEKDKEKPAAPTPTPPATGSLLDSFKGLTPQPKTPAGKDAPPTPVAPPVPTVRQERWEFGAHGIAKKGETK